MRPLWLAIFAFGLTFTLRVRGITHDFWLLHDQMRDWTIALGRFADLPLVGPPTHVGGYTIGPAFYWILWSIRVTVGPWFDNLPHGGGIGQALLQSAADALLLIAIWRRTGSPWLALTTVVLLATAPYDLALAPIIWNPVVGSTLAKIAVALVLLDRRSVAAVALTAAVAWSAVHAYTGAVFVALGVFAALLLDPLVRRDPARLGRTAAAVTLAVVLLQVPYVVHQLTRASGRSGMGAVVDSVRRVVMDGEPPEITKSLDGYLAAVRFIQVQPWNLSPRFAGWALVAAAAFAVVGWRRDPVLLVLILVPQAAAVAGYSFFLAELDHYYYLSLMPAAVLTVVLGLSSLAPARPRGVATAMGVAMFALSLALVPARLRAAAPIHSMPEYGVLLDASKRIVARGEPMRSVRADFRLPPTADPAYLFKVLGGRFDRSSPWSTVIRRDGSIVFLKARDR